MLQSEFETRVGMTVTPQEYSHIEVVYMNSDVDKDEFCRLWKKMNQNRIKAAKVERMERERETAFKDSLLRWFNKIKKSSGYLTRNYNTKMAYIKISAYEVRAMSFAGISLDATLSDVHYEVGKFLGIYRQA